MTKTELLQKPDPWAIVIGIGEVAPEPKPKDKPTPPPAQPKPIVEGWHN